MSDVGESPLRRLQAMIVWGAVLMAIAGLVLCSPRGIADLPRGGTGVSFVTSLQGIVFFGVVAVSVVGGLVIWRAQARLKSGLELGQWTGTEIETLRRWVNSPLWGALLGTGLLAFAVGGLLMRSGHSASVMSIVMFTFPMNVLSGLRAALRPPDDSVLALYSPDGLKPVRSEHWGARREATPGTGS